MHVHVHVHLFIYALKYDDRFWYSAMVPCPPVLVENATKLHANYNYSPYGVSADI